MRTVPFYVVASKVHIPISLRCASKRLCDVREPFFLFSRRRVKFFVRAYMYRFFGTKPSVNDPQVCVECFRDNRVLWEAPQEVMLEELQSNICGPYVHT